MSTREIRTSPLGGAVACDVCGRTLLRGERAHPFLEGSEPRTVCELCTGRARREGWLPEGAPATGQQGGAGRDGRRSLLERLRARRRPSPLAGIDAGDETVKPAPRAPAGLLRRREPRHVRAVPSSPEQRRAAAVKAFNASEHTRTIAGVARTLGPPAVAVWQGSGHPSIVTVTVAWELSWYRYQVDLAAGEDPVRLVAQGSELAELSAPERRPNASADERGLISPASRPRIPPASKPRIPPASKPRPS